MTTRSIAMMLPVLLLLALVSPAEAGGRDGHYGHAPAYGYGHAPAYGYGHGSKHYGSRHAAPRHWSDWRGDHDGHRKAYRNGYRTGYRTGYRHGAWDHGARYRHAPRYAYPRHFGDYAYGHYTPHPRYRPVGYGYWYDYGPGVYLPPLWFGGVDLHFRF